MVWHQMCVTALSPVGWPQVALLAVAAVLVLGGGFHLMAAATRGGLQKSAVIVDVCALAVGVALVVALLLSGGRLVCG